MMTEPDEMKIRLVDLGKDQVVYIRDQVCPSTIRAMQKGKIYIGKYGFECDFGGEYLFSYYYVNYGDTWAFTEEELKEWEREKNGPTGTVYVVTSGEYSEYHIDAVFFNKDNADRYVEANNNCHRITDSWRDLMQVEEFELEDRTFLKNTKTLEDRIAEIVYDIKQNRAWIREPDGTFTNADLHEETLTSDVREACEGEEVELRYCFRMRLSDVGYAGDRDKQKERILKIAQDRYAQYKARMEGVAT